MQCSALLSPAKKKTLSHLIPQNKGSTFIREHCIFLPHYTASHSQRRWSSVTAVRTSHLAQNPGGAEIFRTRPDRPWGPPNLLYNGYRVSFPGVKRQGRGVDHPPPSSAEVKERVEIHLYSPSGPSWPVLEWTLPYRRYPQTIKLRRKMCNWVSF
jgi:hypothetical protein